MSKGDLAYSNQALPAHTDTAYFTDPAGLQIFHCLKDGEGGETLLVDSFYAAKALQAKDPKAYDTLSRLAVPFHASGNEGTLLRPPISQPVLRHDHLGNLLQARWNNEDRCVLGEGWSPSEVREWYRAAKAFEDIVTSASTEYWSKLTPGTLVGKFAGRTFRLLITDGLQSLITGESCMAAQRSRANVACVEHM